VINATCSRCGMWHPSVFANVPGPNLINIVRLPAAWVCAACQRNSSMYHHRGQGRDRAPTHRDYKARVDMGMNEEDDDE